MEKIDFHGSAGESDWSYIFLMLFWRAQIEWINEDDSHVFLKPMR